MKPGRFSLHYPQQPRCSAAYWFTSSTSFANPAVTLARSATNTFAGIRPTDAPGFIVAQLLGASAATLVFCWLYPAPPSDATVAGTVAPSDFSTATLTDHSKTSAATPPGHSHD